MRRRNGLAVLTGLAGGAVALAILAPIVMPGIAWPVTARDVMESDGYAATGATNLVSAIYLGYRAFDTLGETIVLLVALAGAVSLVASAPREPSPRDGVPGDPSGPGGPADRGSEGHTDIINVVAGKLAPIVLLFGAYVMLYGHVSPGGGFQGGIVFASGVIFIAIGRRSGGIGRLAPSMIAFGPRSLARIEAVAFAAILALSFPGSAAALAGMSALVGGGPIEGSAAMTVAPIIALNIGIGLKVGAGVALMCVMMLGGESE